MRYTSTIIFLSVFGLAQAQECQLQQTVSSVSSGNITEVRNITTDVIGWGPNQQKCIVSLDGLYNGVWRKSFGEYVWDGSRPVKEMCAIAVSLAKKNLLQVVNSSTIRNESVVICRDETKPKVHNTTIGTIVNDITQLRPHPTFQKSFDYKGEQCRWFVESGWSGKDLQRMNGIACLTSSRQWIVVDKF
jgi:hypothetical protein